MKWFTRAAAGALALALVLVSQLALASQNSCVMPTVGTVSGLTLVNDINACTGSLLSVYSGGSAPSSPTTFMLWLDTSQTPKQVKQYDGTSWNIVWYLDDANHLVLAQMGGGTASVASAATTDLGAVQQTFLTITGTTTINAFGATMPTGAKILTFSGVLQLTYNAGSMILPGGLNITTAAGDSAVVIPLGGGNWRMVGYTRADGSALIADKQMVGAVVFGDFGVVPSKYVRGQGQAVSRATYPDYFTAVSRTQTGVFVSGNATITSVADTSDLGPGMPIEGSLVNAGCTISSVTSSTIVMSAAGCATGTGTANFSVILPGYGQGGNSSTVGVKNCQGRAIAGTDSTGTILSSASWTNNILGNQTNSITLLTANLPPYTPSVGLTNTGSMTVGFGVNGQPYQGGATGNAATFFTTFSAGTLQNPVYSINPGSLGVSANPQGGTSTPITFSITQPTVTARCLVRVFGFNRPANDNHDLPGGRGFAALDDRSRRAA